MIGTKFVSRRKFDHAEALKRYNKGERVRDLAPEYGVTETSIYSALQLEKEKSPKKSRNMTGTCLDCGVAISRNSTRCITCSHKAMTTTVRDKQLRCTCCKKWKSDEDFHRHKGNPSRRYRGWTCKDCAYNVHKEYREKNRVPCDGGCGRKIVIGDRRTKDKPYLCVSCTPKRATLTREPEKENFLPLLGRI